MAGLQVVSEEQQEKTRPAKRQPEQSLRCPRCNSTNTKFCYYNNYSLSQPRYFCKGCRRYWTKGGSLRNVPVGGGCRKNKRTSNSKRSVQDQSRATNSADSILLQPPHPPPRHDTGHGLTLDFASLHKRPSAPDHDQESCLLLGINNPIHGNLLEATATISGFQSMYYDYSAAGNGDADGESAVLRPRGGAASGATMTNATTVTTIVHGSRKDEAVDGVPDDVDKVLMGLPWLQVAGKDGAMELNSGRGEQHCYWNEPAVVTGSSTWNSFINTSLM